MFPNLAKPSFGATPRNSVFGFGNEPSTSNPFGQNQLFGKPANTGFGTAPTPSFGQTGSSVFPVSQSNPPTNTLFTNRNVSSFGNSTGTSQTAFGPSMFGNNQQASSTNLFGGGSSFGQQNKPTGFGFGSTPAQPLLFSSPQQSAPPNSNIFQPSSSTSLFGTSSTTAVFNEAPTGTVIKFSPLTGSDTMMKGGITSNINTKHHCITCMKEYEGKSLEELRWEDYQANRKGPQQAGFGNPPFGASGTNISLFGQTQSKTAFGQTPSFGAATPAFGMNNQNQTNSNYFGKPNTGFGATTTASNNFGFSNTVSASPFGGQQTKPFAPQGNQTMFGGGTMQPTPSFGSNVFGLHSSQASTNLLFNKSPSNTAFNTGQGFSFNQPTSQTNLFSQPKSTTSFPLFGQTSNTTAFGQAQTNFGQGNQSLFGSNTFGKTMAPSFGQQQSSFGTGLGMQQSGGLFGQPAKQGSLFGATPNTGFSFSNVPSVGGFGVQQAASVQSMPEDSQQLRDLRTITEYDHTGHISFLLNLTPLEDKPEFLRATDPKEIENILKNTGPKEETKKAALGPPKSSLKHDVFDSMLFVPLSDSNTSVRRSRRRLYISHEPRRFNEEDDILGDAPSTSKALPVFKMIVRPDSEPTSSATTIRAVSDTSVSEKEKKIIHLADTNSDSLEVVMIKEPPGRKKPITTVTFLGGGDVESENQRNVISMRNSQGDFIADDVIEVEDTASEPTDGKDTTELPDDDKMEEILSSTRKSNNCGVILSRPEYFTYPSLDELDKFMEDDGRCMIKGFTVGRIGYGSVYFPDSIDVSNLNLDEIVHIRHKEVVVYPEGSKHVPLGQGLNRKAQITLNRIFPRDKNGTPITNSQTIIKTTFTENLMQACEEMGSRFVEYRPESGTFVFNVDHFTRYGLADKYEEVEIRDADVAQPDSLMEVDNEVEATRITRGLGGTRENPPEEIFKTPHPITMTATQTKDEHTYTRVPSPTTIFSDAMTEHTPLDNNLFKASHVQIRVPKDGCCVVRTFTPTVPRLSPVLFTRSYMDVALFKGKSFRVGWQKGLVCIVPERTSDQSLAFLQVQRVNSQKSEQLDKLILASLGELQNNCTLTHNQTDGPVFKINSGISFLESQRELVNELARKHGTKTASYWADVWSLCSVLWGPDLTKTGVRSLQFSDWLQRIVSAGMTTNTDSADVYGAIFEHLSVHRVAEAADFAAENNLPRLSLLISVCRTLEVKEMLRSQLNTWIDNRVVNFIDQDLLKIYLLLAGVPVFNAVNVCNDLDWKRALAVHLWYIAPYSNPLSDVINKYESAFKDLKYAVEPFPPYQTEVHHTYDVTFKLLKLFSQPHMPLNNLLLTSSYDCDYTDYSLSWLLMQLCESLNVGSVHDDCKNAVHTSFAAQLENVGYWQYAIFVLLFMKDYQLKKVLVMGVLDRNLPLHYSYEVKNVSYLVTSLGVPKEWIHATFASKCKHVKDFWGQFQHSLYIGDGEACHSVMMNYIGTNLIINKAYDVVRKMLSDLAELSGRIYDWDTQGGLILDFLQMRDFLLDARLPSDADLSLARVKLLKLCNKLKSFPTLLLEQNLCLAEMSRICCLFVHELFYKFKREFKHQQLLENSMAIEALKMPPDYKLDVLDKCILQFLEFATE